MRCGCRQCGGYMIQAESERMGCVCPECGYHCGDCLGTDTVVSRNRLKDLAMDPRFDPEKLAESFQNQPEEDWPDWNRDRFEDGGY